MNDIEYGWCDSDGKKYYDNNLFDKKYRLQSPDEILSSKIGVCWDQVELERKILDELKIPSQTFFISYYGQKSCPTHTFITYRDGGKIVWFEHSWERYRGTRFYESLNSLIKDVRKKFIKSQIDGVFDEDKLVIREYDRPKPHLSCAEFYQHCEKGKIYK